MRFLRLLVTLFEAALVGVIAFSFQWPIAEERFVLGDEGFHLYAAKLVSLGLLPGTDFGYSGTGLMPLIYGVWFMLLEPTLIFGRLLSTLLSSLTAVLVFFMAQRLIASKRAAWAAVFFYLFSYLTFAFQITGRPEALASSFSWLAIFFCTCQSERFRGLATAATGVFSALAAQSHPALVVIIPCICFLRRSEGRLATRALAGPLAIGLVVGSAPTITLVLRDPASYLANVTSFLSLPKAPETVQEIKQHFQGVGELAVQSVASRTVLVQGLILFLLALPATLIRSAPGSALRLLAVAGGSLSILSLLPGQEDSALLSLAAPFGALLAGALIHYLFERLSAIRLLLLTPVAFLAALFLAAVPTDLYRFTRSGDRVAGALEQHNSSIWTPRALSRVSLELSALAPAGSLALASWPGYLIESPYTAVPGTESRLLRSRQESASTALPVSFDELRSNISTHPPVVVVIGYGATKHWEAIRSELATHGYARVYQESGTTAYRLEAR